MDYTQASGHGTDANGNRCFVDRDDTKGINGTDLVEADLNAWMNEIINIIKWGGLTPDASDLGQAVKAIAAWVNARPRGMLTFGASGTFTVPADVFSVEYELWGAGGAAGGSVGSGGAGAGGGAGAYVRGKLSVTPGQEISVIIGKGGVGTNGADGTSGGSSFIGSDIKAIGGSYGTAGVNTTSNGWGLGGKASGGNININGYPGQGATSLTSTTAISGQGGGSFGGGPSFSISVKGNGAGGTYPGGGGSGSVGDGYTGGAGSDGACIFRW
ncbi:glycine-rich domain-containing protein [Acetobacter senegalensis]|uniref:glycine-rich domain-containing protein n=1 Tax=Acetobacter senegalensis TaxID=446692 RepID=UPI00264C4D9D|nr:hypothetical protein [Acetobacter senegalensis]MDN7351752.1 hypothetical protein [Acetobacter senegalensis]